MAKTACPPGVWTAIPDTGGAMLLETKTGGVWVCTDGTNPVDKGEAYALGATDSMVIAAGLPVTVFPASVKGCTVASNPV